jgi:transcriptional regulator with GAF, ATPase, and Fis domain
MQPRIVGIAGPFQGQTLPLPEGEITLGREHSNQLWSSDAALSRRHCSFIRNGPEVRLKDFGSRNGTRVNSVPVRDQRLQHGDQISIGFSLFVFLQEGENDAEDTHSNPVIFDDTTAMSGVSFVLPQEESTFPPLQNEGTAPGMVAPVRARNDLNALLKFSTAIGSIRDRESLEWQLLGFIFDVIPAERGSVVLLDSRGNVSSTRAWDRVHGPENAVPISQAILNRVVRERSGLLLTGEGGHRATKDQGVTPDENRTSLLCVPMLVGERVTGVIYLDAKVPTVQFDQNHLRVLQAIAHIAALASENLDHWEKLRQENLALRAEIGLKHDIIGSSPSICKVFEFIRKVAHTDSTVLIQGESGTGKELVARAIHSNSPRADRPFVAINSAAIAASLLETELFGHEKGAFTGAASQKKGKVELAEGGTLFLDEIGELAAELQAKLLRVLQEREFERVGGTKPIPLDVRLVAATNKSLVRSVEAGEFRKDLFYRLNVVAVTLPPLRDRREDIAEMAGYFIRKMQRKCPTLVKSISLEALACLSQYDWPGNVRELENAIERAAVLGTNDVIRPEDLPENIIEGGGPSGESAKYYSSLKEFKKQLIQQALQQANGSYVDAAKILGLHPNSLLRLIRNLNVKSPSKGLSSSPGMD